MVLVGFWVNITRRSESTAIHRNAWKYELCTHISLLGQAKRVTHKGSKKHETRTMKHDTCFLVRAFCFLGVTPV
jgi:hypothetical protein